VMVGGTMRKLGGKLVGVDIAALAGEVEASRQYLAEAGGHRVDLFKTAA